MTLYEKLIASLLFEALQSACVQARYTEAGSNDPDLREIARDVQLALDGPRTRLLGRTALGQSAARPTLAVVEGKRR